MLNIEQALSEILQQSRSFGEELVELKSSLGRVLAEDIVADRDYPPFNRASMDGYACKASDLQIYEKFDVLEAIHAGTASESIIVEGTCAKIMTGAPVPQGADTIIRVEDSEYFSKEQKVRFTIPDIKKGSNIAIQGEDCKIGTPLIVTGRVINSGAYSTMAALGKSYVKVCSVPKVVVISTGTELKQVGSVISPHQIRDSNSYSIEAFFEKFKIPIHHSYIVEDNLDELKNAIRTNIQADILLLSGGVSMGDADYVPAALKNCGIHEIFHKVNIKPGKPIWFGAGSQVPVVFALPGNPFSVQVGLRLFVEPFLHRCLKMPPRFVYQLPLFSSKVKKTKIDEFFPCRMKETCPSSLEPVQFNGSGDISAMLNSDGFGWLKHGDGDLKKGDFILFFTW